MPSKKGSRWSRRSIPSRSNSGCSARWPLIHSATRPLKRPSRVVPVITAMRMLFTVVLARSTRLLAAMSGGTAPEGDGVAVRDEPAAGGVAGAVAVLDAHCEVGAVGVEVQCDRVAVHDQVGGSV